jgi:hypothetical protein
MDQERYNHNVWDAIVDSDSTQMDMGNTCTCSEISGERIERGSDRIGSDRGYGLEQMQGMRTTTLLDNGFTVSAAHIWRSKDVKSRNGIFPKLK